MTSIDVLAEAIASARAAALCKGEASAPVFRRILIESLLARLELDERTHASLVAYRGRCLTVEAEPGRSLGDPAEFQSLIAAAIYGIAISSLFPTPKADPEVH